MSRRTDVVARRVFGARTHGRALGSNVLSTSLAALLIHLTVGVAVVELRVSEGLSTSRMELYVSVKILGLLIARRTAGRVAR